MTHVIIAVDGPAASGKGTLAKRVAAHYGLRHLDTGSLYRAVARDTVAHGGDLTDASAAATAASRLDVATLTDPALRSAGLGEAASWRSIPRCGPSSWSINGASPRFPRGR